MWNRYKGYRDGMALLLAFLVCLLLWISALFVSPVVVETSWLVPSRVVLSLLWFVWTMVVVTRKRPGGSNAWVRAYRGEALANIAGVKAILSMFAVICIWCLMFGLPGLEIAALPADLFGSSASTTVVRVEDISYWRRRWGAYVQIKTSGINYTGSFLWVKDDPVLMHARDLNDGDKYDISCLRIHYRAWFKVAVVESIQACAP